MVLALIGIIAALLAANAGAFLETAKEEPPERVLRKAVLDATYLASETKGITYLRYDDENGTLVSENAQGAQLSLHRIVKLPDEDDFDAAENDFSLIFEAEVPLAGVSGDEVDWEEEEISLSRIAFHPSGVSTPFLARLRTGFGDADVEKTLRFDPFSGYPRLKSEDDR